MKKIIRSIPSLNDGSIIVNLDYEDGTRRCIKYARFLMEKEIGRELTRSDVVVHKDGDTMNFALNNLELTTKSKAMKRRNRDYSINTLESRVLSLIARADEKHGRKAPRAIKNKVTIEVAPKSSKPRDDKAAFICGQCRKPSEKSRRNLLAREQLGKPAFCSNTCAATHNFLNNPKAQESLRLAREKNSLLAEAKRVAAKLAALTPA